MTDKLRGAIDHLQGKMDDCQIIDPSDHEELEAVLEAAWKYWDIAYAEGDPWDE